MCHIGFMGAVHRILRCVCFTCSRLRVNVDDPRNTDTMKIARITTKDKKTRLVEVEKICQSKKKCQHCEAIIPRIYKRYINFEKDQLDEGGDPTGNTERFSAHNIYKILKAITPKDRKILGFDTEFSRPEWLMQKVVAVPGPPVRPPIRMGGNKGGLCEDDITHLIFSVVKVNTRLKAAKMQGDPAHTLSEWEDQLQYYLCTLINNEINNTAQQTQKGSNRPLKSFRQRIVGKAGRVRQNLMGKRVDFSARTVITGDPNILIDQVRLYCETSMLA